MGGFENESNTSEFEKVDMLLGSTSLHYYPQTTYVVVTLWIIHLEGVCLRVYESVCFVRHIQ